MEKMKRILLAVDFSECSRRATEWAAFLAARMDAPLEVMHVIEAGPFELSPEVSVIGPDGTRETIREVGRRWAGRQMEEWISELRTRHPSLEIRGRIETGRPAETIAERAKGFDLVVAGTHGRVGLSHFLMGSVAEKIVRLAPCAVLTVRGEVEAALEDA